MKQGEIYFRRAVPADAALWTETRQKAWAATYRGIYPDGWIDRYDFAGKLRKDTESLENPNLFSWLVMDGTTCAGYFSYGPDSGNLFYLKSLYLLPGYQRKGLGRRILEQLKEDCRRLGYTRFYNHCNQHNLPARAFYEKMGGKLVAIDSGHSNKAEDQCRYEYDLQDNQ